MIYTGTQPERASVRFSFRFQLRHVSSSEIGCERVSADGLKLEKLVVLEICLEPRRFGVGPSAAGLAHGLDDRKRQSS